MDQYKDIIDSIGAEWTVVETFPTFREARKFRDRLKRHLNSGTAYYAVQTAPVTRGVVHVRAKQTNGRRVLGKAEREALVEQFRAAIHKSAFQVKIHGGHAREDVIQAMYLAAWEATGSYDPDESSFSTHLYWRLKGARSRVAAEMRMSGYRFSDWQPGKSTFSEIEQLFSGAEGFDITPSIEDGWQEITEEEWAEVIDSCPLSDAAKVIVRNLIIDRENSRDLAKRIGRSRQLVQQVRRDFFSYLRTTYDRDLNRLPQEEPEDEDDGSEGE